MKIFVDIFSNDELCSDTYPIKEEGCVYVIQGKMVKEETGGDYGIAANAGEDDEGAGEGVEGATSSTVIDFVSANRLQETPFTKKVYMAYIKGYMMRVKAHLEKENPDRVKPFMAEAQAFVKKILTNFDDYVFYTGASQDDEAMCPIVFYGPDGMSPFMYIFKDGVREEKC